MISEEELAELRAKEVQMKEQRIELEKEVRRLQLMADEARDTRKKIAQLRQLAIDEEKKNQKVVAKLEKKKSDTEEKIRAAQETGKTGFSLNSIKLATDEMKLSSHHDKLAKITAKLNSLTEAVSKAKADDKQMKEEANHLERYCTRLRELASQVPPCARLMMKIVDMEAQLEQAQMQASTAMRQRSRLNSVFNDYEKEIADLRRRIEETTGVIEPNKGMLLSMTNLLTGKTDEISVLRDTLREKEDEILAEEESKRRIRNEIEQMNEEFMEYQKAADEKLRTISMNFDEKEHEISETSSIEVNKKRILVNELEQKLGNLRTGIATRSLDHQDVSKLTEQLEMEWNNHQLACEEYQKGKSRIEKLRVILDHKIEVIKDLEEWCPLSSKPKVAPGLDEFMFLFDVVFTRNRELAQQLSLVQSELAALKNERI